MEIEPPLPVVALALKVPVEQFEQELPKIWKDSLELLVNSIDPPFPNVEPPLALMEPFMSKLPGPVEPAVNEKLPPFPFAPRGFALNPEIDVSTVRSPAVTTEMEPALPPFAPPSASNLRFPAVPTDSKSSEICSRVIVPPFLCPLPLPCAVKVTDPVG
jgi:hypothetical protein